MQASRAAYRQPRLSSQAYAAVCALVYRAVGIDLGPGKQNLVESRLASRLRALDIGTYEDYLRMVEGRGGEDELVLLLDAISTNVTSFFREPQGLEAIAAGYREARATGQRKFRYWSAACSSGEEPYSLAMLLAAQGELAPDLAILATDISTRMLAMARAARYGERAVASIPAGYRKHVQREGETWRINRELRALVVVNRLNLMHRPFPMRGPFDAILCRNVMIYFDMPTKTALVACLADLLRSGGLLVTGQAESLAGGIPRMRSIGPAIYQRI